MALIPDFPLPNNYFTGQANVAKATPDGLAQILNYTAGASVTEVVTGAANALVLDARAAPVTVTNQFSTTMGENTEVDVSAMQIGDTWFLQITGAFTPTVSAGSGALNDTVQLTLYNGAKENLIEFRKTSAGVWMTLLVGD